MIRLIDNSKAVEISIRDWDEENTQYSPDWSADFFEVGGLKTVDVPDLAYIVEDVDYCIEQANDMVTGEGDFAEYGPQDFRYVSDETELIAFGLCVCVFDAMFPQHVVMRSVSEGEMLREVAFPDDRRLRLAVSDKAADRMTAYRSGLGNVQVAYSRMFDGLK